MIRKSSLLILLLFVVCTFSFTQEVRVSAMPDWLVSIKPDFSRKPDPSKVSDGYYLALIDNQVNLANQSSYYHYIRYMVNESGVQNASEVSVLFSPAYEQVIFHKVSVIRDGKALNQLSLSKIKVVQEEDGASDYLYNGQKRAFLILKDVRVDDQVEVAYSIRGFNPVFANRYSNTIYFESGTAVSNYFQTIIVPTGRKLHFQQQNGAVAPEMHQLNGSSQVYRWLNPEIRYREDEPDVPSWFDNYPYVSVTEYGSWKEVTDWGLSILKEYSYTLPDELQQKILTWRAKSKGDKAVFSQLAIEFVQDKIRYLGMEIGANTHQPYAPAQVFRQRYGDCKDKALLLAMILRSEQIPAYLALVNTQMRATVKDAQPSPYAFNHAIVAIDQPTGWRFIDATSSSQRGNLASRYIPAYGEALILKAGHSALTPIVPGPLHRIAINETLTVSAIHKGPSTLEVSSLYEGGGADRLRESLAESSLSETEESYLKYYTKLFPGIKKGGDLSIKDDSAANHITVKENYSIPVLWESDEKKEKFDVFARIIYDYLPGNPSKLLKDLPQSLPYPRDIRYTLELKMPEVWGFTADGVHIKNDSYEYVFTPVISGDIIKLEYRLLTFKDHIPAEELDQFKKDYKKIWNTMDFELYRDIGTSAQPVDTPRIGSDSTVYTNAVWFSIVFILLLTPLYRHLNRRHEPVFFSGSPLPIRGWTAFLGVCLGLGILAHLFNLFNSGLYNRFTWMAVFNVGGSKLENLLYIELGLYLFDMINSVVLLYWFVNRRDIFPKMFIAYIISMICGQLVVILLHQRLPESIVGNQSGEAMITYFVRTLVLGLIWARYLLYSEGPRNTFTRNFMGED